MGYKSDLFCACFVWKISRIVFFNGENLGYPFGSETQKVVQTLGKHPILTLEKELVKNIFEIWNGSSAGGVDPPRRSRCNAPGTFKYLSLYETIFAWENLRTYFREGLKFGVPKEGFKQQARPMEFWTISPAKLTMENSRKNSDFSIFFFKIS